MTSGTHLALTVTLSGGTVADARAVVRTLEAALGAADALPGNGDAMVHTATFDNDVPVHGSVTQSAPPLSAPVTVTLQGSPEAVRRAGQTLDGAFIVHDEGTASGDQEQERQLRLE
jgi:alkanesulfonate monooxygenase SsuD/methylene tetrahydromethanopterin reductase-like flavin-dependent oxidoreductase (luciferase family)